MAPWDDLSKAIPGIRGIGAHVMASSAEGPLLAALTARSFKTYVLEGSRVRDAPGFFQEIARALEFPGWFGGNWDAVWDCLRSVGDKGSRVAVILRDADHILRADVQVLLDAVDLLGDWAKASRSPESGEAEEALQVEIFLLGRGEGFPESA